MEMRYVYPKLQLQNRTFVSTYINCKLTKKSLYFLTKILLIFLSLCDELEHYLSLKAGDRTRHICHPPSGHHAVCLYGQGGEEVIKYVVTT